MALGDRIKESFVTTGTGTISLDGTVSTFQTFITGIEANAGTASPQSYSDTPYTAIQSDASGNNIDIEIGRGTVTVGTGSAKDTLTRDSVTFSSNGNALVDWGAGTKTIVCAPQASDVGDSPFWRLGKTSDQGSITSTPVKVTWEATEVISASGITVSLTDNRVTTDKSGTYDMGIAGGMDASGAQNRTCTIYLYKNGSEEDKVILPMSVIAHSEGVLFPGVTAANGDYWEIYAKLSADTLTIYSGDSADTYFGANFFGMKVGD